MYPTDLDLLNQAGTFWGALMTAVIAISFIRKRLSRDKLEVRADDAHIKLVEKLQEEKDKALHDLATARAREDSAWLARNDDAKLIGKLSMQVEHLTELNQHLQEQISLLREELQDMRNELAVFKGAPPVRLLKDIRDHDEEGETRV